MNMAGRTVLTLCLALGVAIGAEATVTTTAVGSIKVEASNPPPCGWVDLNIRQVAGGVEVSGVWVQTGSSRMHYRNSVRVDVQDDSGEVVSSRMVDYLPKIRSYGRRDKVWTLHYRLAEVPADAALITVVFLPRNG